MIPGRPLIDEARWTSALRPRSRFDLLVQSSGFPVELPEWASELAPPGRAWRSIRTPMLYELAFETILVTAVQALAYT